MRPLKFSIDLILPASNRNECQESCWGARSCRCIRLASVSRLCKNVVATTSHNPTGIHGLLQGHVYYSFTFSDVLNCDELVEIQLHLFRNTLYSILKAWSLSWNTDVRDECSLPKTRLGRTGIEAASVMSRSQQTLTDLQGSGHINRKSRALNLHYCSWTSPPLRLQYQQSYCRGTCIMRTFIICTPHQMKERLVGHVARMPWWWIYVLVREPEGHWQFGSNMSRWDDEYDGRELTGLIWLSTGISGVISWIW
jgi:hypothetical protein